VNVPTGEFRALSDQADRVGEYHRREALLIRTLAAEISGGDGPLASDDVVRYLADAVIEQGRQVTELREPAPKPRHLHAVK
jgi:hypothetical protein